MDLLSGPGDWVKRRRWRQDQIIMEEMQKESKQAPGVPGWRRKKKRKPRRKRRKITGDGYWSSKNNEKMKATIRRSNAEAAESKTDGKNWSLPENQEMPRDISNRDWTIRMGNVEY